jgi:molecular chaperone Hsp33
MAEHKKPSGHQLTENPLASVPNENQTDRLVRGMAADGAVRVLVARTTQMVSRAQEIHGLYPVPSAALGRLLTGAAMMAGNLKNPTDALTLQIRSEGPIGGLIAVSDVDSFVRGYANVPDVDLPLNAVGKLDVGGAVGAGTLHVIKDLGMRDPYVGTVPLISGEIAEDLTWYHASSEQTPTVMALGVLVAPDGHVLQAGGLMLQLMPDADETLIGRLETLVAGLPPITTMLAEGETPEAILVNRFAELGARILDVRPTGYRCTCGRERMERNLISLGRQELADLGSDPNGIELTCHFCEKKYHFSMTQVRELADMATRP